ncbi:MAG: thioredoxin family protein [Lewinellaceae bacterium]|nr:thioredoxin family protein [Saprospiraceae bacterium]MCB9338386.1 thioredoxin family protein [Lewinellaceae bacterium]
MKKFLGLLALLAVAAGFILAPKFSGSNANKAKTESPELNEGLSVGETAPDFSLKNVDGSMVSLASVKNPDGTAPKGYIVTFTCNTCPYAVMYEDRIIDLHNKYAAKGWPVVAIQPNDPDVKPGDSYDEMKVRAKEKEFPFAYLFDEGQKVFPQYGATRTPHVFLLDNTRKVRYIGAIDNNPQDADAVTKRYLEDAIAALEAGKNPDPDYTKAIGCGIKTK